MFRVSDVGVWGSSKSLSKLKLDPEPKAEIRSNPHLALPLRDLQASDPGWHFPGVGAHEHRLGGTPSAEGRYAEDLHDVPRSSCFIVFVFCCRSSAWAFEGFFELMTGCGLDYYTHIYICL